MAILAGIDEAGFGPVIGPLIVSCAAFEVPDELLDASMWKLLASAVGKSPTKRRPLAFADSKKLFGRRRGAKTDRPAGDTDQPDQPKPPKTLEHLERGVLSMLGVQGRRASSLRELLAIVSPAAIGKTGLYPWYAKADPPLPRNISATNVELSANALGAAMRDAGIAPAGLKAECVFVGEYNDVVQATDNKSETLFSVTSRLIMHAWELCGQGVAGGRCRLWVDRQGGRSHYLRPLQLMFDGGSIKIIDETDSYSAYRVVAGGRTLELAFATKGEDRQLPVALASMLSKYLRELFMEMENAFWSQHVPDLTPTAGYYVDGRRFFEDIAQAIRRLGVDERLIYRER